MKRLVESTASSRGAFKPSRLLARYLTAFDDSSAPAPIACHTFGAVDSVSNRLIVRLVTLPIKSNALVVATAVAPATIPTFFKPGTKFVKALPVWLIYPPKLCRELPIDFIPLPKLPLAFSAYSVCLVIPSSRYSAC